MDPDLVRRAADKGEDSTLMVDVVNKATRSAMMSGIRGANTQPELAVRRALWHRGFRYRLHGRALPGRPDIVLPKWDVVVFVHGCFWHRHPGCSLFRLPQTRTGFWDSKLAANRARDLKAYEALASSDWRVAVVWECALKRSESDVADALERWLRAGGAFIEVEGISGTVRVVTEPGEP